MRSVNRADRRIDRNTRASDILTTTVGYRGERCCRRSGNEYRHFSLYNSRNRGIMFRTYLQLSFLSVVFTAALHAQGGESTQILGTVEDTSGALIPGVTVTVIHAETRQQRQVSTGDSGNYVITNINPGT